MFKILCDTFCLFSNKEISKLVNEVSEHIKRALQMQMLTLHRVGPESAQGNRGEADSPPPLFVYQMFFKVRGLNMSDFKQQEKVHKLGVYEFVECYLHNYYLNQAEYIYFFLIRDYFKIPEFSK